MTVEQRVCEPLDQFPIGMRVLAVDDNPTCLRILERLLHQCQYHVTVTNQATTALKLLRENKDKFDLVISDVEMPDMDGFKLLELVGLEMDLPVIMLSGHSDPKFVMKGITHGACDYLLKPVRIEELKNIWQHVIRRRKSDNKRRSHDSDNKDVPRSGSGNDPAAGTGNLDMNDGKLNKKRKEQDDEEEDENEHDNEESSTQKKPRVVWSVDLHRKFVAAVNQLGIDKAVPKKILDLMNVEKLSRENVASHLQKYRLYLKRISCVANQQASMAAVLTDPHYLAMSSSLGNLDSFHRTMSVGPSQFQRLRSFPSNGMLGRLNSPTGLGIRDLSSSGMYLQNSSNSGSFPQVMVSSSQNSGGNILQGIPLPLEFDQLQSNNNNKGILGNPAQNGLIGIPNNILVLDGPPPQNSHMGTSINPGFTSHIHGDQSNSRLDNWSGAVSSSFNPINTASQNGNSNPCNQFDVSSLHSPVPNSIQLHRPSTDTTHDWNNIHNSSMNYQIPYGSNYQNSRILGRSSDFDLNGQSGFLDSSGMKQTMIMGPTTDALLGNPKDGYLLNQQKQQGGFIGGDAGSLDDIVNCMVKKEQHHTDASGGGDLGYNGFNSLRTCI